VGQQFHATADGLAAAGRLLEVLDEPAPLSQAPAAEAGVTPPCPSGAPLRFERVSFTYPGSEAEVLCDLNLTLAAGEFVAITGPSGAGKSTLAALALRLADPTAGSVSCGGTDLRSVAVDAWRSQAAWVPQRAKLFADTLAANIALAVPDAGAESVRRAVAAAGLSGLVASLPDGLATRIGDGARRLSAGEAQRVALARAFLADSPLVVLDEPTANLDDSVAEQVGDSIVALARDRTVLLITHDQRLAARADRIVELAAGRVTETPIVAVAA
jgi:ABC-type multidrug transport system fused ATPase/permease subunit